MRDVFYSITGLRLPDFYIRHIFVAKLRVVILLCWWFFVVLLVPELLLIEKPYPVMLVVSFAFLLTTICHVLILKKIQTTALFLVELFIDACNQTFLVYIMGGGRIDYFSIYIIYCAACGYTYHYRTCVITSLFSLATYFFLILSVEQGWVPPYSYLVGGNDFLTPLGPWKSWGVLAFFLCILVYGVHISSYFTKLRENELEKKNAELLALNKVASITQSAGSIETIIHEILKSAETGMGYEAALLFLEEEKENRIVVHVLHETPYIDSCSRILKRSLADYCLPRSDKKNWVYQTILKKRLVIRQDLTEVFEGSSPVLSMDEGLKVRQELGFRKFVVIPMTSEWKVLGALIVVTKDPWVNREDLDALHGFATQAALSIENVKLIDELKEKNKELEQVNHVKSEFLATMSHELRTPLTAIIGFSELLLEESMGGLNSEQVDSLKEVLVNGENLLQLINSILDLAKIEAGKVELELSAVEVEGLVRMVQGMVSSLVQKKEQLLFVELQPDIPLLHLDQGKIRQILINLLSNAIKFTPEKGKITLTVVFNETSPQEGTLVLKLSDTGRGIAKEDLEIIFESFRQVDSSFTREYQGTGLGLALVRQFVQIHGGGISVESRLGEGTSFEVSIPTTVVMG